MRQFIIVCLLAALTTNILHGNASAGWFDRSTGNEYDSYEECILDKLEGVTSDVAAKAIMRACAKLTSGPRCAEQTLSNSERSKINGTAQWFGSIFRADLKNNTDNFRLIEIEIRIIANNAAGNNVERKYIKNIDVLPYAEFTSTLFTDFEFELDEKQPDFKWWIASAKGCVY